MEEVGTLWEWYVYGRKMILKKREVDAGDAAAVAGVLDFDAADAVTVGLWWGLGRGWRRGTEGGYTVKEKLENTAYDEIYPSNLMEFNREDLIS